MLQTLLSAHCGHSEALRSKNVAVPLTATAHVLRSTFYGFSRSQRSSLEAPRITTWPIALWSSIKRLSARARRKLKTPAPPFEHASSAYGESHVGMM